MALLQALVTFIDELHGHGISFLGNLPGKGGKKHG